MPSGALRRAARLFPADFRWKCGKLRGCAKNVREGTLFGNSLLWYHGDKGRIDSYSAHMLPWSVTATQSTAAFHLPLPGPNSWMRTACTLLCVEEFIFAISTQCFECSQSNSNVFFTLHVNFQDTLK